MPFSVCESGITHGNSWRTVCTKNIFCYIVHIDLLKFVFNTTTWNAKVGFCNDFVLLTKTEGNVTGSGYRNARGYGYVSLFNLRFTWLFSKITETYIVKHNGFFFFQSKCYILGIINSLMRLSKLILSDFLSQTCWNLNCSI